MNIFLKLEYHMLQYRICLTKSNISRFRYQFNVEDGYRMLPKQLEIILDDFLTNSS